MSTLKELCRGYENRRVIFEEIKNDEPTIIEVGEAKAYAMKAKINRLKKVDQDVDIMELLTWSRKELRGHAM